MKNILFYIILIFTIWLVIVSNINRFKNPDKTETRLLLDIPKNIMLKFD